MFLLNDEVRLLIKRAFFERNPCIGIHERVTDEFCSFLEPVVKMEKFRISSIVNEYEDKGWEMKQLRFGKGYDNGEFCVYLPSNWIVKKVEGPNILIAEEEIPRVSIILRKLDKFKNEYESWVSNNPIFAYYYNPLFYPDFNQLITVVLPERNESGWVFSFFDEGEWVVIIKGNFNNFNELCDILTVCFFSSPWKIWLDARREKSMRQKVLPSVPLKEENKFSRAKEYEKLKSILEQAISDTGIFLGITKSLDNTITISFNMVQLLGEEIKRWMSPSSKYALAFKEPEFVSLLVFNLNISDNDIYILEKIIVEQEINPMRVTHNWFTLSVNKELLQHVMKSSPRMIFLSGKKFDIESFLQLPFRMLFLAGTPYWLEDEIVPPIGVIVGAKDFWVLDNRGVSIEPEKIKSMYEDWWLYYTDYWKAKESENPYAEDLLCESIIPCGEYS